MATRGFLIKGLSLIDFHILSTSSVFFSRYTLYYIRLRTLILAIVSNKEHIYYKDVKRLLDADALMKTG